MKSISAALAQHLAGDVTTPATCWKIAQRDGVLLGFTNHMAVTIERLHVWQQIPIVELRT
jgi:hypothetical protein